jgi:hypothetical protein
MDTSPSFLDEATRNEIASEMGRLHFADTPAAVKHLAYLAKCGKRFSEGDVMTILSAAGLSTDGVPAALGDLAKRRILDSYLRNSAPVYFMERGARIDYGESLGHPSRVSRGTCLGTP